MPRKSQQNNNDDTPEKSDEICSKDMSYEECELAMMRQAIMEADNETAENLVNTPAVRNMIGIVESFIAKNKLICYGGTAINNILPPQDQFYDLTKEIPDYDFFSPNALEDAKTLANTFYILGYVNVEAKSGVHHGTYKVFVDYVAIADITQMHPTVFAAISKEVIIRNRIRYAPPNYLRMSMYLELSRPKGDTSRWEKVLTRLNLLNKHYPILAKSNKKCNKLNFQRNGNETDKSEDLYYTVRDTLLEEDVVFFGGYAAAIYSKYMPPDKQKIVRKVPDFDVLSNNIERTAKTLRKALKSSGVSDIRLVKHGSMNEILPTHIEVIVGTTTVAYIYKPLTCHNYNTVYIDKKPIRIATIDTLLSFYLAFIYTDKPYFDKTRIICIADFLFDVMKRNRLENKGMLKRFTMECYGTPETLDVIKKRRDKMYEKLKNKVGTKEYNEWFLKYNPDTNRRIFRKRGVQTIRVKDASKSKSKEASIEDSISDSDSDEEIEETPGIELDKKHEENDKTAPPSKSKTEDVSDDEFSNIEEDKDEDIEEDVDEDKDEEDDEDVEEDKDEEEIEDEEEEKDDTKDKKPIKKIKGRGTRKINRRSKLPTISFFSRKNK